MTDEVFGNIVSSGQVEDALLQHLRKWLPTYLAFLDRDQPLPDNIKTANVRAWEVTPYFDLSDEPQMPAIKIVSPGPTDPPVKDGQGIYRGVYEMSVVAIVTSKNEPATKALRDRYAAAIVGCVMQKRSLGDPNVRGTDFHGVNTFDLPAEQRRTKMAVSAKFLIEYENIIDWKAGPSLPIISPDPFAEPPSDPTEPIFPPGDVRDPDSDPPYTPITITQKED